MDPSRLTNIVSANFLRKYVDFDLTAEKYLIHPDSLILDSNGQIQAKVIERIFQGDIYRLRVIIDDSVELSLKTSSSNHITDDLKFIRLHLNADMLHPL